MGMTLLTGCVTKDGFTFLEPNVVTKVDQGVGAGEAVGSVVVQFLPQPWATIGSLLIGALGTGWATYKGVKIKRKAEYVELGAKITADSVRKVIMPVADVWDKFKEAQKSASSNTKAIMPDKL